MAVGMVKTRAVTGKTATSSFVADFRGQRSLGNASSLSRGRGSRRGQGKEGQEALDHGLVPLDLQIAGAQGFQD
jgi:hypothetical protein